MPGPPGPQGAAVSDHFDDWVRYYQPEHMQMTPSVQACCSSDHVADQFVLLIPTRTQTMWVGGTSMMPSVNLAVFCSLGTLPGEQ